MTGKSQSGGALSGATAPIRNLFAGMNKTEAQRAFELEAMKRAGGIADWWFEAVTFKLADDCRHTPDFLIQESDGSLRLEETKGFWRDDAKVKTRVMMTRFPFPLRVLRKTKTGWDVEEMR